ncbi:SusC/RagA family TonB-linked outer membrane protein [Niabella beijingensis]|uniref:SusC/RagA family TonB-linked outer membrane protein n=1 Tax=Niabella beijingensis TaxID=2872700 RepID=UPI001CBB9997|nr:SusC/RagA family TonB-linked outer membrane protein [Niabella beijingensis]MBZ4188413.1 SusC/RagA family TonB-linked outer membrane protein [Niabella beijingensis]
MKNKIAFALFLRLLFCGCMFYSGSTVIAQVPSRTITGHVRDSLGKALIGVTVSISSGSKSTVTGTSGAYSLSGVTDQDTLSFSFVGFTSAEEVVGTRTVIDVKLNGSTTALSEVVVIGYGTAQKKDLTGAVASIKASRLENENPSSVQDIVRGNVPGVNATQGVSAKGVGNLTVRGKTSLTAGTNPLIVLDGVIYQGQLADINPNDVANIDVLKDASSAAVFGSKAASGVILVTTKRGSSRKPQIVLNSNVGFAELSKNEPLYDGPGFLGWRSDVFKSMNAASSKKYIYDDPRKLPDTVSLDRWMDGKTGDPMDIWMTRIGMRPVEIENYKAGRTTDWYDMMFQKGLRQDHTLSLSGRSDAVNYYMSLGYTNNKGIIVGDQYKTIRARVNLEGKIADWMSAGMNFQFADRDESQVPVDWGQMINASPYGSVYNDDGSLRDSPNDDLGNNANPFADNHYVNRLRKNNTLFGTIYLKGTLPYGFSYQINYTPNFDFYRYFNGISADHPNYRARMGFAERTSQTTYNWQWDNLIKWNRTFGEHQFDVTFLVNAEKFQSWQEKMTNEGFTPSDVLSWHNIGAGIKPIVSSDDQKSTGDALMGRLNYTFKNRYLFTASVRRDGYSAFGLGNPRATFPALAAGWIFTDENFMKNATWINYGKLRYSWGVNGNRDIGRYVALSNLETGKYQYITADGTTLLVSQLWVDRMANPGLKWEQTTSNNIGFDFAFLNNRLSGSIDVYKKKTKDLLVLRSLPNVGGFDNRMDNLGGVENRGFEIALNSTNITGENFSWRSTVNFWLNRNKITSLYGKSNDYDANGNVIGESEKDDVARKWFIGHDINSVWDQKVLGVWQESEAEEAAKYGVAPGDFKIEDVNGDYKYSDADRQFLGYSTPRFQWTLRNEFTIYKNFDFAFMIYSNWGQLRPFNRAKNNTGFLDRSSSYTLPYWTPENPINDYARLFSSNGSASYDVYRKASFIRLSTISLAYTVPKRILERAKIQGLKFYISASNLAVFAPDWDFWDPEYFRAKEDFNLTEDNNDPIPSPRNFTFGLNLTL